MASPFRELPNLTEPVTFTGADADGAGALRKRVTFDVMM
jgi:hypothetical protein